MSRRLGLIPVFLGSLACAPASGEPGAIAAGAPATSVAGDGHGHQLDVDWVPFSEAEIHSSATAIVHGRVVRRWSGTHRTYPVDPATGRELGPEQAGDRYAELPLTTSLLVVDEVLRLRAAFAPRREIEVVQLGGRYADGCWVEPNDQPILDVSEEVVVFVKPAGMVPRETTDASAAHAIVGGQQGLVRVRDGLLEPIPGTVFAPYAGRPVAELARDARRYDASEGAP